MGKSPGKWIKAKLFGKKSTKSSISKKGEAGKEVFILSKSSSGFVVTEDSVISDPQPVAVYRNGVNLESGNQTVAKPVDESTSLLSGTQDGGAKSTELTSVDHSYSLQQEQAAAKVQAALRGFLARRAFWALKGIIRLQALIRGHLVRQQAVATLHCMQGIVQFQALVRGRKVRLSEAGMLVKDKCDLENLKLDTMGVLKSNRPVQLSRNVFAQKLLAALPNATPLSLHYDSDDANSAWNWVERWSTSHFWELVVEPKKDNRSKNSRKFSGNKGSELENGRPKCGVRRNSSTNHDNGKPRAVVKRSISHQAEFAQENNQTELEKVERNLRKFSLTKPKTAVEKPKIKVAKMRETASPVVTEQDLDNSVEKHRDRDPTNSIPDEKHHELMDTIPVEKDSDPSEATPKEPETITPPQQVEEESLLAVAGAEEPSDEPLQQLTQKDENSSRVEELCSKEDSNCKENQRARRRRSLSTKHEYPENGSQKTPTLPSYMQATESVKAKLRTQGSSPRLSQDTPENGAVRRHSLPTSTSGKLNTPSPRIQKLVQQGSSKGGVKSEKALSASRDYNNSNERVAEWRR